MEEPLHCHAPPQPVNNLLLHLPVAAHVQEYEVQLRGYAKHNQNNFLVVNLQQGEVGLLVRLVAHHGRGEQQRVRHQIDEEHEDERLGPSLFHVGLQYLGDDYGGGQPVGEHVQAGAQLARLVQVPRDGAVYDVYGGGDGVDDEKPVLVEINGQHDQEQAEVVDQIRNVKKNGGVHGGVIER